MDDVTNARLIFVMCVAIFSTAYGQQCNVVPKCSCQYGDDNIAVQEQDTGSEALAGAVGALGSLVVSGGAFGLWYLLRGRVPGSGTGTFSRSGSSVSEESVRPGKKGKGPPPAYINTTNEESGLFKGTNIYMASRNDELSHKVGVTRAATDL